MIGGYATLAVVTDVDPSGGPPVDLRGPAMSADDLARLTGGRLLTRSSSPPRMRRS